MSFQMCWAWSSRWLIIWAQLVIVYMYIWAVNVSVCMLHIMCLTEWLQSLKVRHLQSDCTVSYLHRRRRQEKIWNCWPVTSNPTNMFCAALLCNFQCKGALSLRRKGTDLWQVSVPQRYPYPENLDHPWLLFPAKLLHSVDLHKHYICHVHVHPCSSECLRVACWKSCLGESGRVYMLSLGCVIICRYSMTPGAF